MIMIYIVYCMQMPGWHWLLVACHGMRHSLLASDVVTLALALLYRHLSQAVTGLLKPLLTYTVRRQCLQCLVRGCRNPGFPRGPLMA